MSPSCQCTLCQIRPPAWSPTVRPHENCSVPSSSPPSAVYLGTGRQSRMARYGAVLCPTMTRSLRARVIAVLRSIRPSIGAWLVTSGITTADGDGDQMSAHGGADGESGGAPVGMGSRGSATAARFGQFVSADAEPVPTGAMRVTLHQRIPVAVLLGASPSSDVLRAAQGGAPFSLPSACAPGARR